eukprot:839071_1
MHVPDVIIKHIAECATGELKACANKACASVIPVLKQDLEAHFKTIGYKFNSGRYFCGKCMDQAVTLGYCVDPDKYNYNEWCDDCCCDYVLHYKPNCDTCPCGSMLPELTIETRACAALNDCACCTKSIEPRDCGCCNKTLCSHCWDDTGGICQGCDAYICSECTTLAYPENMKFPRVQYLPGKMDITSFGDFGRYRCKLCLKCVTNANEHPVTKQCKGCKKECNVQFDSDEYLFDNSHSNSKPLMIKCNADECDNYVCYGCREDYLKCSHCDSVVYPATLCETHTRSITEIACPSCWTYEDNRLFLAN